MKKLLIGLLTLTSLSSYAAGQLDCVLETVNSHPEKAEMSIFFLDNGKTQVFIEGEQTGLATRSQVTSFEAEINVLANSEKILELRYEDTSFSQPSKMEGSLLMGVTEDGEMLYSDIVVSCEALKTEISDEYTLLGY